VAPRDRAKSRSLFFDDLLDTKVREFNPRYTDAVGALPSKFRHLHTDIYGNREFLDHLRNRGKFFDHEEKRELDLVLIDYDMPENNIFEVTEELVFFTLSPTPAVSCFLVPVVRFEPGLPAN